MLLYQKITLKQFYFIFKIRILLPFINCQWNTNGIKQNELSKLFIIGLLIFPNIFKLKKLKMSEKNFLYDSLGMFNPSDVQRRPDQKIRHYSEVNILGWGLWWPIKHFCYYWLLFHAVIHTLLQTFEFEFKNYLPVFYSQLS